MTDAVHVSPQREAQTQECKESGHFPLGRAFNDPLHVSPTLLDITAEDAMPSAFILTRGEFLKYLLDEW